MIEVGTQLPPLQLEVTRADLVRYAGASGDFNPIHYSDAAARAIGQPGVIAHGMWTMGASLRIITDWVKDPARVISYFVRFISPVAVPETGSVTVDITATVTAIDDGVATIAVEAKVDDQKVLGAAKAQVRVS